MIRGQRYEFGVSGRLYKRNLLFYDRQTGSLWSQLLSESVTGPMAGTRLAVLPAENTTWAQWRAAHPETRVLSFVTGFQRNYKEDPYASFPLRREPGILVRADEEIRIYPFSELQKELKKGGGPVVDQVGGHRVTISFDSRSKTARVETDNNAAVTYFESFLNDLKAFYPEASVYKAPRK